ncbi:DNA-binding protein [Candidatus Bathyarchaeota archaeon]|nr:MAG: DNA-binding protein [Candidatus Bathyarchaeota archaeon]
MGSAEPERIVVLDSTAFITGVDLASIRWPKYTVPEVEQELPPSSMSWTRFKAAVDVGEVKVLEPDERFVREARLASRRVGDERSLSEVDLKLVALALELRSRGYRPLLATDDYAVQNVASQAGIEHVSLATLGITHRLYWILQCPACRRTYPPDLQEKRCPVCGTELKRKPKKRIRLKEAQKGHDVA